jgi:hypothetical protein
MEMAIDIKLLKKKWAKMNTPKKLQAPKEPTINGWYRHPFVDFDDPAIPLWIRKERFMTWIRSKKGMTEQEAMETCARKFYYEERYGETVIEYEPVCGGINPDKGELYERPEELSKQFRELLETKNANKITKS